MWIRHSDIWSIRVAVMEFAVVLLLVVCVTTSVIASPFGEYVLNYFAIKK